MKRRWIIRGLFIGLLVVCVGGWVGSYQNGWEIGYGGRSLWGVTCQHGKIHLIWEVPFRNSIRGWEALFTDRDGGLHLNYWLGFSAKIERDEKVVAIPLWFPTTISAALLWLTWRKTRSKPEGRAFPVELGEKVGKP